MYIIEFRLPDLFGKKDGKFDTYSYHKHPEQYKSKLEPLLPYINVVMNCIYWEPKYPKLMSLSHMKKLYEFNPMPRLRLIGDISCDICGSNELTAKATTSEKPMYVVEPVTEEIKDGVKGFGPVILAQDKLPTEVPRESSTSFGEGLIPIVLELVDVDFSKDDLDLPKMIKSAVIAHKGKLTKKFEHLSSSL